MKKLTSVFTDDFTTCWLTGRTGHIEVHHIYPGFNRKRSERYGYVVPLHATVHPNGAFCTLSPEDRVKIDLRLKRECQEDYEKNHGTREDFIREFGRNYLD